MGGFDFVRGDALLEKMKEFPATERERSMASRYAAIRPVVMKGWPDAHNAYLVVDQQSFCVSPLGVDTAEEAAWQCWQLSAALCRLVDQQTALHVLRGLHVQEV